MQFGYFPHEIVVVFALLYIMTVSEIIPQDLYNVPGCYVVSDEFSEIAAKCTEFNVSSTPMSLPKDIKRLRIYEVKNLPKDIPLIPELKKLTTLFLFKDNLHTISKVMFEGLESLTHLSLKQNFIKNIPSDAFMNTPNIEILDLASNYILSIESIATSIGNLKKLKHLSLYNNKLLRFLKDNDFIALENTLMESLDISYCIIEYIERNTFKPLKSLISLNISYNPLSEEGLRNISISFPKDNLKDLIAEAVLEDSYFSCRFLRWLQTTGVESLNLSENRFICFPKGNYKYLRSLIINKCSIFGTISFSGMPNLDYLEIKRHQFLSINNEFKSNARLKFLDLSNFAGNKDLNSFQIVDYAFENQTELMFLYLKDLPLKTKIKRYMLYNLRKLENLSFYKCKIPAVECNAFETLNNLVYLDFSFNILSELTTCSFYGLTALKNINLSNNMISFITESHPFDYTPNLEILNLNANKIVNIPPLEFEKLNNLFIILLGNNLIQPWHHSFLPRNEKKVVLLVSENAISYFTTEMLDDVSNLEAFDFSKNPINCSHCSILELRKWMRNSSSVLRNFHTDGAYSCSEPDTLFGVNIVEANLTLSYCYPEEKDTLKIIFIILSPILFITIIITIVWYRWSWNIKYCLFLIQLNTKKYKDNLDSGRYAFDACVFYCDSDIKWIRRQLVPSLEGGSSPLRLCLPDRNFTAGAAIIDSILSAIDNSRSTIIILSNKCLEDSWCLYNMQMAQNMMVEKSRSGLIVILIEDIPKDKLKKDLQYVLHTRTCIWWTENPTGQKLFWERVRLAIMRPLDRGISAHIT